MLTQLGGGVVIVNTAGVSQAPAPILVLASGSRFRAKVLAESAISVRIERPDVDERALDELVESTGPEEHSLMLAEAKARSVAERLFSESGLEHGRRSDGIKTSVAGDVARVLIIGADQLGVIGTGREATILHKQSTVAAAVDQLMSMSGTTHRLVNGLVVIDANGGRIVRGTDVMTISMRAFTRSEATAYVERFEPFDSAGSYRIEDQEDLPPEERFITMVDGEDPRGVLGMPVPLLIRLLESIGARITEG